jgi:hypothetical protein
MNCLFCQKITHSRFSYPCTENRECVGCSAYFLVDLNGTIIYYYFDYQDYRIYFWPHDINIKFKIMKRARYTAIYENIVHLQHLPNITPSNIDRKLKTILTFL